MTRPVAKRSAPSQTPNQTRILPQVVSKLHGFLPFIINKAFKGEL